MNSKFPMIEKLGLKVTSKLVSDFTGGTEIQVTIKAEELEALLQSSKQLFFNVAGDYYSGFSSKRNAGSTFSGLLLAKTQLKHCLRHIPKLVDKNSDELNFECRECEIELNADFSPKETE